MGCIHHIVLFIFVVSALASADVQPVHVAFLTDCSLYSDWQSIGDTFSFKMSGQRGSVTRVMCCEQKDIEKYNTDLLKEVETHIAPSLAFNPKNKDHYAAYNKPEAVIDWLNKTTPKEEFVLVLDSDMILRYPFLVEDLKPKKGLAVGAKYTYMIGVANDLATRHIPHVKPRNDTLAGPYGRRADQVGGFFFIHRDDLKRMSRDWLRFSEEVRFDTLAYKLSGDSYAVHPGDKPWISEMYGYAFGAANNDVWHVWDDVSMIYPQYEPLGGIPKLLHYGLEYDVEKRYTNDKHRHYNFDVTTCPPWGWKQNVVSPDRGLFPFPPHPTEVSRANKTIWAYVKDLISLETTATLNAAFCDYHLRHCPPSEELLDLCGKAIALYKDSIAATAAVEKEMICMDESDICLRWKKDGECESNPKYMGAHCQLSCGTCRKSTMDPEVLRPPKDTRFLDDLLEQKRAALHGEQVGVSHVPEVGGKTESAGDEEKAPGERAEAEGDTNKNINANTENQKQPQTQRREDVVRPTDTENLHEVRTDSLKITEEDPETAAEATTDADRKKKLILRCYRLGLSLTMTQKCVTEAKQGGFYMAPPKVAVSKGLHTRKHLKTDFTLHRDAAVDGVSGGSETEARTAELATSPKDTAAEVANAALDSDPSVKVTRVLADGDADSSGSGSEARGLLSGVSTWQLGVVWLLVLLSFFALLRVLLRRRTRSKQGRRTV